MKQLTVLHTSDWHIGHQLCKRRRDDEFAAFLDWLVSTIQDTGAAALIVAGDVFDSAVPGSSAQRLYYDFLHKLSATGIRHVIITSGNHDSPALLTAASGLLRRFNIHVIGGGEPEEQIRVLPGEDGEPELIVCAAPYLRERDLRLHAPGESVEETEAGIIEGMRAHYARLAELAEAVRAGRDIPVIATGHLFVIGAALSAGNSERPIHSGALCGAPPDVFPENFDYVALGHLHSAQIVGGNAARRYSGSPLALDFNDAGRGKSLCLVRFGGRTPDVQLLPAPVFRSMRILSGDAETILAELQSLAAEAREDKIWVEIRHSGRGDPALLNKQACAIAQNGCVEVLCVKTDRLSALPLDFGSGASMADLDPEEVFSSHLRNEMPDCGEDERERLVAAFRQLLADYYETLDGEGR